jgi:dipeptidyl-peptidase-4
MKKIQLTGFVLLLSFIFSFTYSQNKELTLEEVHSNYALYPFYKQMIDGYTQLTWIKGTDNYSYISWPSNTTGAKATLYIGNSKGKEKAALEISTLNEELKKAGFKELGSRFPRITWLNENEFYFSHGDQLMVYSLKSKDVRLGNCCNANAANMDIEENELKIAFTKDNNLYISINPDGAIPVTQEENKDIVSGQAVHRREFGISKGTFWSPKGNYLAFYQKDESMVTDYPIVDIDKRVAEDDPVKYPMAGMKSHHAKVGVYNVKSKEVIFLKTGEPKEQYLTNVTWSPDEKYIYVAVINRDQNHMKLNKYDAATGDQLATLFEEKHDKYVEPENGPIFFKTKAEFLWFSDRSGYKHLYRYSLDGELIEKLTDGEYDVMEFLGFSKDENLVFYRAVDEDYTLQKHLYAINIESKMVSKVSTADGVHEGSLSESGDFILNNFSSHDVPRKVMLIEASGLPVKTIYEANNPFSDYKVKTVIENMEVGSVKADDGTDLYYRMLKPVDFDPNKKYPVVFYVYGGPHMQLIDDSWMYSASHWMLYMADQGYIVFSLDNRGSANRGQKFEQAIFRNMGTKEVADQMKGVEFLKKQKYVDANKIGVHGWSYGGFMTISLMLKQPETFKVGVSGAPVIDWKYYEVMYGERYMDTPEQNEKGYEKASLLNYVKNLDGKLLVIHGTSDETVVWQHTLRFIEECIHNNVQVDYFVYPGHDHSVSGKDRLHLYYKISNYFHENLK